MIALSPADRERLESGDLARPEDALGEAEPSAAEPSEAATSGSAAGRGSGPGSDSGGLPGSATAQGYAREPGPTAPSAADARILREVPPHFGRL